MIRILPADQQLPQAAELACQLWPSPLQGGTPRHPSGRHLRRRRGSAGLGRGEAGRICPVRAAARLCGGQLHQTGRPIWRVSLSCRSTAAAALPAGWWTPARAGRSCRAARSLPATASLTIWRATLSSSLRLCRSQSDCLLFEKGVSSHQWVLYRVSLFYGARGLYPFCVPTRRKSSVTEESKEKGTLPAGSVPFLKG